MRLTIEGNIPNKKDALRPRRRGKMYYDKTVKDAIHGIVIQLQSQWNRPPLECAEVVVYLYRKTARFDPDGQKATVLDALKQAGVIIDDNAARVPIQTVRACRRDEPGADVLLIERQSPWPQPKRRRADNRKAREILQW